MKGSDTAHLDSGRLQEDWVSGLRQDVTCQIPERPVNLVLNLGKGTLSSTPRTPSPRHPIPSNGKDMNGLMDAGKKEGEKEIEKEKNARAKAKAGAGKQKVASRSSSSRDS